jgi:ABC-type transport system involved in cytochrome bd biosynthesis fused ATPase/permease subunit
VSVSTSTIGYLIYLLALELFAGTIDAGLVWTLALGSLAAVITKGVAIGLSSHLSHIAVYTILYDLRIEVGRKLGTLPLGYFSDRTTGEIKKVIHEDVEQLEEGLAHMVPDLIAGITVPLILLAQDVFDATASAHRLCSTGYVCRNRAYQTSDDTGI